MICFCPDGVVPIFFNIPGLAHYSQVVNWGNIYDRFMMVNCKNGATCTVYFAFGKINYKLLVKSYQDSLAASGNSEIEAMKQRQIHQEAT